MPRGPARQVYPNGLSLWKSLKSHMRKCGGEEAHVCLCAVLGNSHVKDMTISNFENVVRLSEVMDQCSKLKYFLLIPFAPASSLGKISPGIMERIVVFEKMPNELVFDLF